MGLPQSRIGRAILAMPFLLFSGWCLAVMDLIKIVEHQKPFVESGVIEWEGGRVSILDNFHHVRFLDEMWRGTTATFAPSTLGFDPVARWQMFSFLNDLSPIYAVWILESCRPANAGTPAYLPTFFSMLAQVLGIGVAAPLFYFLCLTFGPFTSELARGGAAWNVGSVPLLPLVLLLNTAEVFAMFFSLDLATRHFWTWAWQLTPLWIGLGNVLLTRLMGSAKGSSPKPLLLLLGLASSGVWLYTVLYSPYSLGTLFVPQAGPQSDFMLHARKALQTDELSAFSSSFLWLAYSFFDLQSAGLVGNEWMLYVASLPIVTICVGPGTAFLLGWYWREMTIVKGRND
ncbi:hypothetical protein F4780DRAFT_756837 [Xylariomycetidae sp. FL0641]|nr:hypothetical protein F4780DRAFT_756837 [Xylariomycetidae sp. FL0641]